MNEISIYAVPGVKNILAQEQQKQKFIENLNVKVPDSITERKFIEMWPIFADVCELYHENPVEVFRQNKCRLRHFVEIRMLTMYLAFNKLRKGKESVWPLRVIGGFFGKDHSTTIFALTSIENLLGNKEFKKFTQKLF